MGYGGVGSGSVILALLLIVIPILLFAPIAKKAGYSGWWSLLMIIPLVNLVMIWVFAFVKWPAEKT